MTATFTISEEEATLVEILSKIKGISEAELVANMFYKGLSNELGQLASSYQDKATEVPLAMRKRLQALAIRQKVAAVAAV